MMGDKKKKSAVEDNINGKNKEEHGFSFLTRVGSLTIVCQELLTQIYMLTNCAD